MSEGQQCGDIGDLNIENDIMQQFYEEFECAILRLKILNERIYED